MSARCRPAERLFFAVAVVVLLLNLGVTTAGLRLAGADDDAMARGLTDPAFALTNRLHDFQIGRFYADARFWFGEHLLRVSSDAVHAAIRVGMFFVALLAAAWFAWEWRRSERVAWLVLVSGVGFLPVTVGYQVLLSAPTLWLGWAGVWAMGALALRPVSEAASGGIAAAFALALAAHEANAVFIVWPAMVRWSTDARSGLKIIARELALCGVVLVAYGGLSWALRGAVAAAGVGGAYDGATLSLNVREAIYALNVYTWSGWPALASWLALANDAAGPLLVSPSAWAHRAVEWATPLSVAGAALVSVAIWAGTKRDEKTYHQPRARDAGIAVALLFAAFAPNLLLALTVKYQMWAHQRMWPYYYTSMSYLAWVVLLVGGGVALVDAIPNPAARRVVRVALAAGVLVAAVGVGAANREAAALLRRHTFFHWNEYRQWLPAP
jgi:hypothetical protein